MLEGEHLFLKKYGREKNEHTPNWLVSSIMLVSHIAFGLRASSNAASPNYATMQSPNSYLSIHADNNSAICW